MKVHNATCYNTEDLQLLMTTLETIAVGLLGSNAYLGPIKEIAFIQVKPGKASHGILATAGLSRANSSFHRKGEGQLVVIRMLGPKDVQGESLLSLAAASSGTIPSDIAKNFQRCMAYLVFRRGIYHWSNAEEDETTAKNWNSYIPIRIESKITKEQKQLEKDVMKAMRLYHVQAAIRTNEERLAEIHAKLAPLRVRESKLERSGASLTAFPLLTSLLRPSEPDDGEGG